MSPLARLTMCITSRNVSTLTGLLKSLAEATRIKEQTNSVRLLCMRIRRPFAQNCRVVSYWRASITLRRWTELNEGQKRSLDRQDWMSTAHPTVRDCPTTMGKSMDWDRVTRALRAAMNRQTSLWCIVEAWRVWRKCSLANENWRKTNPKRVFLTPWLWTVLLRWHQETNLTLKCPENEQSFILSFHGPL